MAEIANERIGAGLVALEIDGELDLAQAAPAEKLIEASIAEARTGLLIDLSGCEFIDSTGIELLLRADRQSRGAGLRFAIAGAKPQVRRIFAVTSLAEVLPIFADRRAAVEFLERGG